MIEVEELSFSYDDVAVLSNISLKVNEGEFIGIFGPNGGGKTTLLKLICGLLKASKGRIKVNTDQIGYVPQAMGFDKRFPISVNELVLTGCLSELTWYGRYTEKSIAKAKATIARVGLTNFADAAFGTLSGGQAQRALIARALVSNPKILLLDEPTANVDPEAEEEIFKILHELSKETTILAVTHDLDRIIGNVTRVLCVQGGVTSMDPERVCKHFASGLYHHKPLMEDE